MTCAQAGPRRRRNRFTWATQCFAHHVRHLVSPTTWSRFPGQVASSSGAVAHLAPAALGRRHPCGARWLRCSRSEGSGLTVPHLDGAVDLETCVGTPPGLCATRGLHVRLLELHRPARTQFRCTDRSDLQCVTVLTGRIAHIRDDELKNGAVLRTGYAPAIQTCSYCRARVCMQPGRHVQPHPWWKTGRFRACGAAAPGQRRHHNDEE